MVMEAVLEALGQIVPKNRIYRQEPMSRHTAFRIGGPADVLVEVESRDQLKRLLEVLRQAAVPFLLLGNGSNLLVRDQGYRGVVLHIGALMNRIQVTNDTITAQAGALMSQIASEALKHGLTGFEFASGIPGSIGGGVVMNAGAYGGELKHVVTRVRVLDEAGRECVLSNEDMEFGYRVSVLKKRPLTVTEVELRLRPGDPARIKSSMEELARKRREKQPLEYPSAGSTFKRPDGYFAGELIMKAGLRGFQVGGARVSDKHCGFVINTGNASAADVIAVMEETQRRVKEAFGVDLEPEVIILGE